MKQPRMLAAAALVLFTSTSAMALRAPESDTPRSRPAGSVIDSILNRDAALEDKEERKEMKKQAKRERKRAKELRKQQHKREKGRA